MKTVQVVREISFTTFLFPVGLLCATQVRGQHSEE